MESLTKGYGMYRSVGNFEGNGPNKLLGYIKHTDDCLQHDCEMKQKDYYKYDFLKIPDKERQAMKKEIANWIQLFSICR